MYKEAVVVGNWLEWLGKNMQNLSWDNQPIFQTEYEEWRWDTNRDSNTWTLRRKDFISRAVQKKVCLETPKLRLNLEKLTRFRGKGKVPVFK